MVYITLFLPAHITPNIHPCSQRIKSNLAAVPSRIHFIVSSQCSIADRCDVGASSRICKPPPPSRHDASVYLRCASSRVLPSCYHRLTVLLMQGIFNSHRRRSSRRGASAVPLQKPTRK
ncbi:hypothetical protein E2542_SST27256 [Spatholobus suberectus]|nr:hypothetical protein E2542_SST27256 [Spatholobus suberectus]